MARHAYRADEPVTLTVTLCAEDMRAIDEVAAHYHEPRETALRRCIAAGKFVVDVDRDGYKLMKKRK